MKEVWLVKYKKIIRTVGRFNTLVLLSVVYWAILPFFWLILNFKHESLSGSMWRSKEPDFPNSHEQQF